VKRRSLVVVGMVWSSRCGGGKVVFHDHRCRSDLGAPSHHEKLHPDYRSMKISIKAYQRCMIVGHRF
jgi:hypothetical protein